MSFFKKLTDEFKGLKTKDDKGSQVDAGQGYRGDVYEGQQHGYPAPGQQQYQYGQSQPAYGQQYPPQQQQYSHDQPQSAYGHQQGYGGPPTNYAMAGGSHGEAQYGGQGHAAASLPPGWQTRYDQATDRTYYVTILSQWEPPSGNMAPSASYFPAPPGKFAPLAGGGHGDASRGIFGGGSHGYHNENMAHGGEGHYGQGHHKDDGNKKMMMGAAGGLAVGAAGAYAIHEMTEDEHGNPVPTGNIYAAQPEGAPPGALPATDADGDSVSGSDREDVQEARADYEDAVAEGSQSDIEEAREEYQEEYEETYDD